MTSLAKLTACPYCGYDNREGYTTCDACGEALVLLHIGDTARPLVLPPLERIVLGRGSEDGPQPDLDLTPFAVARGVSRIHAAIEQHPEDGLTLTDLGSTNGTVLNLRHLEPNQPYRLHNNDEIRLGNLVAYIYFDEMYEDDSRGEDAFSSVSLCSLADGTQLPILPHNWTAWRHALELAAEYGWQPALEDYAPNGQHVSDEDACAFAEALERALPDLPDKAPDWASCQIYHGTVETLFGKVRVMDNDLPPLRYFGGAVGRRTLRDLIAFCRKGGFSIG